MAIAKTKSAPAAVEGFNFGDLNNYTSGFGIPDGNYLWTNLEVRMYRHEKSTQPERLGVLITFVPLDDPKEENARTQFYAFGKEADKSYVPNPSTGKGILPVPGAPAVKLNDQTNWMILLRSLFDSGMPQGTLANDMSVLEGLWCHMSMVDEPEERKRMKSATAEIQEARRDNKIAVVTEILDGGAPWEGGGGYPKESAKPKVNGSAPAVVAPKLTKPAVAPQPEVEVEAGAETGDVRQAALDAMNAIMEKNPRGCTSSLLRTQTFSTVKKANGEDVANSVITDIFDAGEDTINKLLAMVGFKVTKGMVKPVE